MYSTIKKITGKTTVRIQTVKSKDGKTVAENNDVKKTFKNFTIAKAPQMRKWMKLFHICLSASMEEEIQIMRKVVARAIKDMAE